MRLFITALIVTFLASSLARGQELPKAIGGFDLLGPRDPLEWAKELKSKDKVARAGAAYALAYLTEEKEKVVPELTAALKDPEPEVRTNAAVALAYRQSHAKSAVPALLELFSDKDVKARRAGVFAIEMIRPELKQVEAPLLKALKNDDMPVRVRAAYALVMVGYKGKEPLDTLAQGLADEKDPEVRRLTRQRAIYIGLPAIPITINGLQDKRPAIRIDACHGLCGIVITQNREKTPLPKEALQALIVALKDEEKTIARMAIDTLGQLGEPAKVAIPALKQATNDPDYSVRVEAHRALKALEK